MSMLDGGQIVYVARSAASRVLAAGLSVGSRLPAYCTSMGRVLLAAFPMKELAAYLRDLKPQAYTPKTLTRIPQIKKAILQVRGRLCHRGRGTRSRPCDPLRFPVSTRSNRVVAAINVGTHVSRVDRETLLQTLPARSAERCAKPPQHTHLNPKRSESRKDSGYARSHSR